MSAHESSKRANRLQKATSPYLLQHAYNPVDWYEWGPEALGRAIQEDKPILVSIGYSSCHWCHVMERESFENREIAQLMNDNLVCIKVDREERPDIDQVYMEAVQAMGMNGGWPLNVFLTPQQKPFYGGTYFNPKHWSQLVVQLAKTYHERREEIAKSAEELTQHLQANDVARLSEDAGPFHLNDFHQPFGILESKFDHRYGGLDRAPKFVMPSIWLWLLRFHKATGNQRALDMVLFTLRKLAAGGIYDQLGGGFARYSVDTKWFAPHFEKMLYDNAQLLSLYAEAYRVSGEPRFREVIDETFAWLRREMKHPDGGFFSALDADSEGIEGKFYTWTDAELSEALDDDAGVIRQYYMATKSGNWEHGRNILYRNDSESAEMEDRIPEAKRKLLEIRSRRIHPALDDKILTGWNAMLIVGLVDAYQTFGAPHFLEEARGIAQFLEKHLMDGTRCYRAFKERRSTTPGFLEDYAHLISAWIALYQVTFEESWIVKAEGIMRYVIDLFRDGDGFFFVSSADSEPLIARKKDLFDNVIPSPNSVMARNLFRMGILLDHEAWKQDGMEMAASLRKMILQEPNFMSNWGIMAMEAAVPCYEVVITGPKAQELRRSVAAAYQPFSLMMGTEGEANLPLVHERVSEEKTLIHVCVDKTCRLPVATAEEALQQLSSLPGE